MDFEEIENLNEENINGLYTDIIEFGDDTKIAGCACNNAASLWTASYRASCYAHCHSLGKRCYAWAPVYCGYAYSFDHFGCI